MSLPLETGSTPEQNKSAVFSDHRHPGIIAASILKKAGFNIETFWPTSSPDTKDVQVLAIGQETFSLYQSILEAPETKAIWACQTGEAPVEIKTLLGQCDWSAHTKNRMVALFHVNSASNHLDKSSVEPDPEKAIGHIKRAETAMDSADAVFPENAFLPEKPELKKLVLRTIKSTLERAGINYHTAMRKYFEGELEPTPIH